MSTTDAEGAIAAGLVDTAELSRAERARAECHGRRRDVDQNAPRSDCRWHISACLRRHAADLGSGFNRPIRQLPGHSAQSLALPALTASSSHPRVPDATLLLSRFAFIPHLALPHPSLRSRVPRPSQTDF